MLDTSATDVDPQWRVRGGVSRSSAGPFGIAFRGLPLYLSQCVSFGISQYAGRVAKPANAYIRWNLLFTFLIFFFISSCIWIPAIPGVKHFAMEIVIIVFIVLHLLWLIAVVNALRYTIRLRRFKNHTIDLTKVLSLLLLPPQVPNPDGRIVKHLVGICIYKEPMELVMDTVDSIASQPDARHKITALVGMEEGTPNKEEVSDRCRAAPRRLSSPATP